MLLIRSHLASGREVFFHSPPTIDTAVTARIIGPHSRMLELPLLVRSVFLCFLVVVEGCETNFSLGFSP